MKIKIRKMNREDVLDVQKLYRKSFLETYPDQEKKISKKDIEKMTENFLDKKNLENFEKNIF
jgi:hypothetical protein